MTIIGEDGTRFLIEPQLFADLTRRGIKLFVQNPINLIGITVNPKSPSGLILDSNEICDLLRKELNLFVLYINRDNSFK